MRGRTLNDAFIILDESQNTTVEQMKMFLTRIGLTLALLSLVTSLKSIYLVVRNQAYVTPLKYSVTLMTLALTSSCLKTSFVTL